VNRGRYFPTESSVTVTTGHVSGEGPNVPMIYAPTKAYGTNEPAVIAVAVCANAGGVV
jgi:hypothetical protein